MSHKLYEAFEEGRSVEVWLVHDQEWCTAWLVEVNAGPDGGVGFVAQTDQGREVQVPKKWVRVSE